MSKIIPVILSGGSGKRLWPLSRKQYPKQYLPLVGDYTMLQETILRLNGLDDLADPIIICNSDHRFLVADQCQQIGLKTPVILLEPIGKNTAPAIAAAALQTLKEVGDAILLVLSADHVIKDVEEFHQAINIATNQAKEGKLAIFGIVPRDANTNYGYIKYSQQNNKGAYKVEEFVEKPELETAEKYLKEGNYLWNSGMFIFRAATLIEELNAHSAEIVMSVNDAVNNAKKDLDFIRLDKQAFESTLSESIDYALMEKSENVVVIPLDAHWNDIGSWLALYDFGTKDRNSNVIQGDVFTEDTSNCYIHVNHHMVATIGVQDLVIVDTPDATLIASKDKAQEVGKIVERLQEHGREEQSCHRKVYRPWGWYDSIEVGLHFQVKRLHVKPGAKLSLQMHHKRAEHWVVVSGIATAINGDEVLTLAEGDSTYIPVGVKHSLENNTSNPIEIIEVQSGSYLEEDDITRFKDLYGRPSL